MAVKENTKLNEDQTMKVGPDVPGYKLIWMINQAATAQQLTQQELSEIFGMAASTVSYLLTARKDIRKLDKSVFIKIAKWLELPVLSVLMLAEQITPEDFYSDKTSMDEAINRATKLILSDPDWGAYAPRELLTSDSKDLKIFLIWCYEKATSTKLLPGAIDYLDLIKELESFRKENKTG